MQSPTTDLPFDWAGLLERVGSGIDLSRADAEGAFTEIMEGRASNAQMGAFLMGLRVKGETDTEIAGAVAAMRSAAVPVPLDPDGLIDIVGTGGDGAGTFNISTTASIIAAGAGARVAKHGNRAASSKTGSADVLEALGVVIDLPPEAMASVVERHGFGFFFARNYHPAMRHAAPVRSDLGIGTIFNILGPMANPAGVLRYSVGVADPARLDPMISALADLGADAAFVVHGSDGLDEISTTGTTLIARLRDGVVTHAEFTPADFGVPQAHLDDLRGGDAATNAEIIREILAGAPGAARDIALVNASAGLVAAGIAEGFSDGMERAAEAVDTGAAAALLEKVVAATGEAAPSEWQ